MKKTLFSLFVLGMSLHSGLAQNPEIKGDPFAHTYSIVARDSITGEMAVGVQSHWFSVAETQVAMRLGFHVRHVSRRAPGAQP